MRRLFWIGLICALVLWLSGRGAPPPAEVGEVGPKVVPLSEPGEVVLDLKDDLSRSRIDELGQKYGLTLRYATPTSADEALVVAEVPDVAAALASLSGESLIEAAEPVIEVQALGWPDDPQFSRQWNMVKVGAPLSWRAGRGHGVRVAVVDTGIAPVSDLADTELEEGRSFVPGVSSAQDDQGHGTHVAGTIAQSTHNGLGVAGIAPGVTLIPLKALAAGGAGQNDWVAAAIDEAVDQGAHVINLSLGGRESEVIKVAIRKALDAGVVVVAAAGNAGLPKVGFPANMDGVIGVSAVGPEGTATRYTNRGKGVEIAAPGGDLSVQGGGILQQVPGGDGGTFKELQGTSMAAPHVTGAVAVLRGMGLSAGRARQVLLESSDDQGERGWDPTLGYGILDVGAAVRQVQWDRAAQFGFAAALLWVMAALAGATRGRGAAMCLAGVTAGGVFFLPTLPVLPPTLLGDLLSRGLLSWPARLLGPDAAHHWLWLSAVIPVGVGFVFGLSRQVGMAAAGLVVGWGVSLLSGAASGYHDPTWLSPAVGTGWLVANAAACGLFALAIVGAQGVMERRS